MAAQRFIPAGRTALVQPATSQRDPERQNVDPGVAQVALQVQTEYAHNPYPRITTTILNSGQVVHKVEKKLDRAVQSLEEQQRVEGMLNHQHSEVVAILKRQQGHALVSREDAQEAPVKSTSIVERLRAIPGSEHIFRLDNKGDFIGRATETQFRKSFKSVFKNLPSLMEVFAELAGDFSQPQRQSGVCEVERDRLYFASTGSECIFITVRRVDRDTDYEKAIKEVISDTGVAGFSRCARFP